MLLANCKKKTISQASSAEIELLQCIAHLDQDIEAIDENDNPK